MSVADIISSNLYVMYVYPDSTSWYQAAGMARRSQTFEERYYFKEPTQSDGAELQPAKSKVGRGDSAGMQVG